MAKIKIRCEAIAKHSGKRCKCKGHFVPTSRRMLCPYHKGGKSWDNKTRKYKGLYKNENINIQNKINILKNLKNFKHKTDDEIKEYILQEKDVGVKGTLLQRQDVCSVLTIRHQRVGIIRPGNIWVYTETIT